MRHVAIYLLFIVFVTSYNANAAVTFFNNRGAWEAATNYNFTNIGFWELPHHTVVTNQYSHLGVTFVDASGDFIVQDPLFHDGWGLYGNLGGTVDMAFSQPMYWIGADKTLLKIELFYRGQLFYTTPFDTHDKGFAGVISDQPFDFVRFTDWSGVAVYIDDLSFGPPIPAPGALALAAIAGVMHRRRRRGQ